MRAALVLAMLLAVAGCATGVADNATRSVATEQRSDAPQAGGGGGM